MIKVLQSSRLVLNRINELSTADCYTKRNCSVHSIYERTVNIDLSGQLISLQTKGSPVSPISVILPLDSSELGTLKITAGQPVQLQATKMVVGNSTISFDDDTDIYDEYLIKHNYSDSLKVSVSKIIKAANRGGFSVLLTGGADSANLAIDYARKKLDESVIICSHGTSSSMDVLCDNISSLIGIGTGLTPSGDDFICGLLSTFTALPSLYDEDLMERLKASIGKKLVRTNEISRAFIECALNGQFSIPVIRLYDQLCEPASASCADSHIVEHIYNIDKIIHAGNKESPTEFTDCDSRNLDSLLQDFMSIGHSSGIDTLTGIWWSLENLMLT